MHATEDEMMECNASATALKMSGFEALCLAQRQYERELLRNRMLRHGRNVNVV